MASADIFIISSSPPQLPAAYTMSSSPPLPALKELIRKPQGSRSEVRAMPVPPKTPATVTSASSLLPLSNDLLDHDTIRSFTFENKGDGSVPEEKLKSVKGASTETGISKAPKKARQIVKINCDEVKGRMKKSRQPRQKQTEDIVENSVLKVAAGKPYTTKTTKDVGGKKTAKENPARKQRAKNPGSEAQSKLSRAQVTKASKLTSSSKSTPPPAAESSDPFGTREGYGLIDALKRRTAWTPPLPVGEAINATLAPIEVLDLELSDSSISGEDKRGFSNLFASFGLTKAEAKGSGEKVLNEGPRKRKMIELVKTNISASVAVTPKEKAPKKRAKTITEQATAAYVEEVEQTAKPAQLLQYFFHQSKDDKKDSKDSSNSQVKKPAKGPGLNTFKIGSAEAPILLSPESALKQGGDQDFVFGTSSQLARENSPTLLRDLHSAMQLSNEVENDPSTDPFYSPATKTSFGSGKITLSSTRSLWSAASRDNTGKLLEIDMVDLTDFEKDKSAVPIMQGYTAIPSRQSDENIWHDIEEPDAMTKNKSELRMGQSQEATDTEITIEADLRKRPVSNHAETSFSNNDDKALELNRLPSNFQNSSATSSADSSMPHYFSYTTAQLSKEIASYHFKPVKNRDQMILLLEKCWEGKQRVAPVAFGTNAVVTTSGEQSKRVREPDQVETVLKQPRGRPRKNTATSPPRTEAKTLKNPETSQSKEKNSRPLLPRTRTPKKSRKKIQDLTDDISESEANFTPSPRRRYASQGSPLRVPLKLSTSASFDSTLDLSPTSSEALLFTHITTAVTSAGPSRNASKPTWHEKILLYDPIILEDLTRWLNTGALGQTGWDGEVTPKEVKKWCESKSICCLWRENLRGKANN